MIKIVNGKIVREGMVGGNASSPVLPTRRRCSIQDLQLKEYEQQELQNAPPPDQSAETKEVPSWSEIFKQQILVFGLRVDVITLCIISIVSLFLGGITGLLVALVGIYLGTLFKKPQVAATNNDNIGPKLTGGNVLGKGKPRPSPLATSM